MTFLHQNLKIAFKKRQKGLKTKIVEVDETKGHFIYSPLLLTVSHRRKRYEYVPIFSELEKHLVKRQLNNYNRRLSKLELKSKG